jgi:hypothetical protein
MRTLTSIESARIVNTNLKLSVTPVDQSTTFVFSNWNIQNITPISYEIDFLGGFGKSSNYQVTLSRDDGLDFWKNSFKSFVKAEVALTILANSDEFTPHIGVVQDITRFPTDPNLIQLQIFDKFFDNVPQYPTAAIVDSYSNAHPEISNNNWGYPSYYGKHARPFYMTPVDCDLGTLVGPINISSENHVTSLYFNRDKNNTQASSGGVYENVNLLLLKAAWNQQSASNNLTTSAFPFEVKDLRFIDNHIWGFQANPRITKSIVQSDGFLTRFSDGDLTGQLGGQTQPAFNRIDIPMKFDTRLKLLKTTRVNFIASITNTPDATPEQFDGRLGSPNLGTKTIFFNNLNQVSGSTSLSSDDIAQMGTTNEVVEIAFFYEMSPAGANIATFQFSSSWEAQLKSENYTNYSIFAAQINCSTVVDSSLPPSPTNNNIAISENPIHILTDIFSQSGLGFVQSQASDTQDILENSGYAFQCFFGERQPLTDISQEFGEITGTYIFVSDSGQINFRAYTESDAATIDTVITPEDYQQDTLRLLDNPLGTTVFDTAKAKRIAIGYNYNFTTGQYESSLIADANNTAACNSVAATGVDNEEQTTTQYFLESDTASMYLSNLLRKRTKDEQIVEMRLPTRFYGLELADIINLQHPILEGSESLYQVTKLKADYLRGNIHITANEIINL